MVDTQNRFRAMSPARMNDLFKEVENFTRFQRIIGMSSLIYSDGKLQISRKWLIISLISISGNSAILLCMLYSLRNSLAKVSDWYSHLKTAYSAVLNFCIVASWFGSNMNEDLLNISLSRMRAVDLQMLSFGKELPQTKPSWVAILIYGLVTAAYFLKVSTMPTFLEWIQLLILYTPCILLISFEDNIDRVASLLRLRFFAIEQQLVQCFGMEVKNVTPFLERLILCHHHLSSSSEDIDEYFSVQVLSLLTVFFLASFCELYAIFIMYKDDTSTNKEVLLAEKVVWIIVIMIIISRICHQFAAISTQAQKFKTLLYQIMLDDKTANILNNSMVKLHITMNREVVFTANGFFKLDYSLLHSMIASSTAYLGIVIQFCKK